LLGWRARGATVYADYAHHTTEDATTQDAGRTLAPRGLVAVSPPPLYSRTALLAEDFGRALACAYVVVVLDVYPARERGEDHPGVSGLLIAEASADAAAGRPVYWLPTFADAEAVLRELLDRGDVCLAMGAGDVDALARGLVGEWARQTLRRRSRGISRSRACRPCERAAPPSSSRAPGERASCWSCSPGR